MADDRALKPSQSTAEARAAIERARMQIVDSAALIREEVANVTRWRHWVGQHPGWFLGGAFAVGFLIAYRRK